MNIEQWFQIFGLSLAIMVMVVSLFGLIIPIFPGTVIIWLVILLYGLAAGFGVGGGILFVIITLLMIASVLADNVLMGAKAREYGASWVSIGLALVTGIVGTIIFPPVGGVIGGPLVLYLSEYNRVRDRDKALATVKALAIGWGWAFVARFGLGALMIGLWGVWVLANRG
jgi:uncharacterized protein YqgC (DUF456 family)